ncbi:hypothetical protein WM40_26870, partial [Robbsia andropogonis]
LLQQRRHLRTAHLARQRLCIDNALSGPLPGILAGVTYGLGGSTETAYYLSTLGVAAGGVTAGLAGLGGTKTVAVISEATNGSTAASTLAANNAAGVAGVAGAKVGGAASGGSVATNSGAAGAGSAQNIATASQLAQQLQLESANSPFTVSGTLTHEAIDSSTQIFPPGSMGNPAIPEGFGKYTTSTYQSPAGNFQVHYYMNPTTGQVYYGLDYKAIFNNMSGVPK